MIPTAARSTNWLRKAGWTAETVEKRHGKFRHDLFGFADVIAYKQQHGILLVQAYNRIAEKQHIQLDSNNSTIREWLLSGGLFEHHIWRLKSKHRSGRKYWNVDRKLIVL